MNKKLSLIITIIIVIFGALLFFIVSKNHNDIKTGLENKKFYLVLNNFSVWKYNKTWAKANYSDVNNKKMSVFIDNKTKGQYYLKYGTTWNLFNDQDEYVNYHGDLIAITPYIKLEFLRYSQGVINTDDLNTITRLNANANNITVQELSPKEKIIVDLDSNGINDSIVIVGNIDIPSQNNYFNIVYVNLNGDIKVLINDKIKMGERLKEPLYSFNNVLLFENSKYGSIVLHKTYYSQVANPGNLLFDYNKKNYQLVIED